MPDNDLRRRGFLQAIMSVPLGVSALNAQPTRPSPVRLESFDYSGVRLLPGRFHNQYEATRDFYLALAEDDLVYGFRVQAGLPAPGKPLDGWCRTSTAGVFGQWLSGMARMAKATGDRTMGDKAVRLMGMWAQCFEKTGRVGGHYAFDKFFCGLLDIHRYTGNPDALTLLRRITGAAGKTLPRSRQLATTADQQAASGGNSEWYTLSENQYRAFLVTGDSLYKDFGDVWRYEAFWSRFLATSSPPPLRVHAYSHVNSFNGLPLSFAVSGDERYLQMAGTPMNFSATARCSRPADSVPASGWWDTEGIWAAPLRCTPTPPRFPAGPGPGLNSRATCSTTPGRRGTAIGSSGSCTTVSARRSPWRGMGKRSTTATTTPVAERNITFGTTGRAAPGTYIQAVADYPNLIYFRDPSGLYINLFVPSEVTWDQSGQTMKLTQETTYPESEEIRIRIDTASPVSASIRFRVPDWANKATVQVNGAAVPVEARPSTWAVLSRTWQSGDRVAIRIPMQLRAEVVDQEHSDRVAILYGPVVLVEDLRFNLGLQMPPGRHGPEDLNARLHPETGHPLHFQVVDPPSQAIHSGRFYPYYEAPAGLPYRMYHDFTHSELA